MLMITVGMAEFPVVSSIAVTSWIGIGICLYAELCMRVLLRYIVLLGGRGGLSCD